MKLEQQRVLAGSLNVLTPSDKTPENDAIELINFRVDQAGVLRVADSFAAMANFGSPIHTLFKLGDLGQTIFPNGGSYDIVFGPNCFLVGASTNLYLYTPYQGAVLLQTGFDGRPLGIVVWNGFIWIMNAAQQLKINPVVLAQLLPGNPVESWLPASPTTACVATADTGSGGGPVGTYTYYCTYVAAITGAESTNSPGMTATAVAGIVSLTGLPEQGAFAGLSDYDDSGTAIGSVNLYRSGGALSGTRLVQVFGVGGIWIQLDFPSTNTPWWDIKSDAEIANAQQPPGSGGPTAPASAPNVVGGPVLSDATEAVGTYSYYVTYVNDAGLETNPGPESNFATSVDGQIVVSQIPISPDPTVWARRVYRSGGTLGQAYQATQLSDNTTTVFVDTQSDLELTELGITMPGSDVTVGPNDPPPAALGLVGPYFNYLLAFQNNRMYWTQNGVPLFPGSSDPAIGNWVNVGSPDDHIMAITFHTNVALIYKQRSVWRLLGDPVSGYLLQTSATIGVLGPRSVANAGATDYIVSTDGLFLYDLDLEHKQSGKLDPIFFGVPQWTSLGASDLPLHQWGPASPSWDGDLPFCAWLEGTLLFGDGQNQVFLYHAETQRFGALGTVSSEGVALCAALGQGSSYSYYTGDLLGNLLQSQQITATGQTAVWQTRFLDQGLGDTPKSYAAIVLDAELNGGFATIYAFFRASDQYGPEDPILKSDGLVGTVGGTAREKFYFDLQPDGDPSDPAPHISVRVEILCLAGTVPPAIHGLYIYYNAEARASTSMITIPFALDPQRGVWQVKEIEYDAAANNATVAAQISIDQPTNAMTVVETDTLPVSTYRRNYQMPQNVSGVGWWTARLFQLYLSSSSTFRLYETRMLARKVGTFIEGYEALAGFLWDSWWLNFGSPQVKVFDQIKLELETAAQLTVTVWTELPGETPAVILSQVLVGTGPRRWYTVELPPNNLGRDLRVQIGANGAWTFYAGKVSMRVEGRYLSAVQGDFLRTLEQDFGSERVKLAKKLEIDLSGSIQFNVLTDEPVSLQPRGFYTLTTNGRQTMRVRLPSNLRGRLWSILAQASTKTSGGPYSATVYAIRAWMRVVGENGDWAWQNFALEPSEVLPRWADLPVTPTPSDWTWVPVPLAEPLDSSPPATAMLPYEG